MSSEVANEIIEIQYHKRCQTYSNNKTSSRVINLS